jgi:hypothetical protein
MTKRLGNSRAVVNDLAAAPEARKVAVIPG